jgi:hypothetical protein
MPSDSGLIRTGDIVVLKKGVKKPGLSAMPFKGFAVVTQGQEIGSEHHVTLKNGFGYDVNDLTRVGSGF